MQDQTNYMRKAEHILISLHKLGRDFNIHLKTVQFKARGYHHQVANCNVGITLMIKDYTG
jgi:hypothetical protein